MGPADSWRGAGTGVDEGDEELRSGLLGSRGCFRPRSVPPAGSLPWSAMLGGVVRGSVDARDASDDVSDGVAG